MSKFIILHLGINDDEVAINTSNIVSIEPLLKSDNTWGSLVSLVNSDDVQANETFDEVWEKIIHA